MDHPVISADGHIDFPLLPEKLWIENAPRALRDRIDLLTEEPEYRDHFVLRGLKELRVAVA